MAFRGWINVQNILEKVKNMAEFNHIPLALPRVDRYGAALIAATGDFLGWMSGRAVECTGLENRRGCKPSVSSNLTSSAI